MARVNFITIIVFLFGLPANAQTDITIHLTQQQFIEGVYSDFYIDNLDNIYLINANNQIKKLDKQCDSVAVSNALRKFGDIYSMDASNALKLLVYYKDFSTIAVLDRFLKNINTIDLRRYGILQAQAIASSYDNNYWVFDGVENKLKKIDDNGNLLLSTPDFRIIFNDGFVPEKITDYNGFVYLFNKKAGCKIFDYYGAFKQHIPLLNYADVQINKNAVYSFDSAAMHIYNVNTFKEELHSFNKPFNKCIKLQKSLNSLYVLLPDGLYVHQIN